MPEFAGLCSGGLVLPPGAQETPPFRRTVTAVIVVLPFVAIGLADWLLWGRLIHPADIVLALVLYTITGLGVTVGFHRGLTHGGYRAVRPCGSRSRGPVR